MQKLFLAIPIAAFSLAANAADLSFYQNKTIKDFIQLPNSMKNEYYDLIYDKYDGLSKKVTQNIILEMSKTTKQCTSTDLLHQGVCEITMKEIEQDVQQSIKEELGK